MRSRDGGCCARPFISIGKRPLFRRCGPGDQMACFVQLSRSLSVAVDCCGLRQRRLRRKLRTCTYVPVEGLRTALSRVGFKGAWDRGGFGPKATATGAHSASRTPPGAKQSSPTTYGRDREDFHARVLQKGRQGKKGPSGMAGNPPGRPGERYLPRAVRCALI